MARQPERTEAPSPPCTTEQDDLVEIAAALCQANRQLTAALERVIARHRKPGFIPTPLQRAILDALKGKALRTDGIAAETGGSNSRIFIHPGGIPELVELGHIAHHKNVGYYRPDAPPPELDAI